MAMAMPPAAVGATGESQVKANCGARPANGGVSSDGAIKYKYANQYQGQGRHMKVIVVGAGLSGIAAVKIFKEMFTNTDKDNSVELVMYEKNHDVTGTWLENRYPGCGRLFMIALHTAH
jgi:hypothetical protein